MLMLGVCLLAKPLVPGHTSFEDCGDYGCYVGLLLEVSRHMWRGDICGGQTRKGDTRVRGRKMCGVKRLLRSEQDFQMHFPNDLKYSQMIYDHLERVMPFCASNGIVANGVSRTGACLAHHVDELS